MHKVVESIRVVKGPMGLRSQELVASPLAWLSPLLVTASRTGWVGKGQGPPGRPPG
jgi:hypothetical protein